MQCRKIWRKPRFMCNVTFDIFNKKTQIQQELLVMFNMKIIKDVSCTYK